MPEVESREQQVKTSAQGLNFYEKFVNGEFGLAKTYWRFGAIPSFFVGIVMRTVPSYTLAYWIGAALMIYQLILLVAIWNAGKKYQGNKVWPVLALLMILMAVMRNIGPILEIGKH